MDERVVTELEEIVGAENVSTAQADRITHSYDATQQRLSPGRGGLRRDHRPGQPDRQARQPLVDTAPAAGGRQRLYRRHPAGAGRHRPGVDADDQDSRYRPGQSRRRGRTGGGHRRTAAAGRESWDFFIPLIRPPRNSAPWAAMSPNAPAVRAASNTG